MVKNVYNLDQVTRIEVTKKSLTNDFTFVKGQKYWIKFFNTQEGFKHYSHIVDDKIYTKEELENKTSFYGERYEVDGTDVYSKPKVTLYFSDKSQKCFYFDTDNEAHYFRSELTGKLTNIHLELFKS